jgi:hypothetical protein
MEEWANPPSEDGSTGKVAQRMGAKVLKQDDRKL